VDTERARQTIAAEPPRRLRLDELLHELGARARNATPPPTTDGDAAAAAEPDPRPERDTPLTVGELVDKAAEGGFGFLIAILSLIAIPFFGLSTPFGLAIALIGAQLVLGGQHPWLPRRARNRALSMAMLDRVSTLLERRTRWIARSTRRRWEPMIRPRLIGLGVVVLALGLALPLPIPGSNLVFLIPLFIYAVGLLERDGLWILIGHAATLIDLALLFAFGDIVIRVLGKLWRWVT
jgi:hypothetical protein